MACLVKYGPLLPIDSSGHLEERKALFRSAGYYCLTEQELDEVLEHKEVGPYLFSLLNYAKQYKYHILKQARDDLRCLSMLSLAELCTMDGNAP